MHPLRRCAAALPIVLVSSAAWADPQALSTFVPVQTQDALVVRTGTLELQGTGVFTRDPYNSTGRNLLAMTPTLKLGAVKGLQVDVSAPYAVGDQSGSSQGAGGFDAICNFLPASGYRPALSVQPGFQTAYGAGHKTDQYFLRGLATMYLGGNETSPRLHLNVNWTRFNTPSRTGRRDVLELGVAYSVLVRRDVALVLDVVHGAKASTGQNQTILDAGLRWEVSDRWALSGGVGVGVGQQSPDVRVIFAVQRDFSLY